MDLSTTTSAGPTWPTSVGNSVHIRDKLSRESSLLSREMVQTSLDRAGILKIRGSPSSSFSSSHTTTFLVSPDQEIEIKPALHGVTLSLKTNGCILGLFPEDLCGAEGEKGQRSKRAKDLYDLKRHQSMRKGAEEDRGDENGRWKFGEDSGAGGESYVFGETVA